MGICQIHLQTVGSQPSLCRLWPKTAFLTNLRHCCSWPSSEAYLRPVQISGAGKTLNDSQVWECTHVITALGRLRQEDQNEFKVSQGYKVSSSCALTVPKMKQKV